MDDLVRGVAARRQRGQPHLDEGQRRVAVVALDVPYAARRAEPLDVPGADDRRVAGRVAVGQLALDDPGDDLGVAVRMLVEAGAGREPLLVAGEDRAEAEVVGVVVRPEGEGVQGLDARPPGPRRGYAVGRTRRTSHHGST